MLIYTYAFGYSIDFVLLYRDEESTKGFVNEREVGKLVDYR